LQQDQATLSAPPHLARRSGSSSRSTWSVPTRWPGPSCLRSGRAGAAPCRCAGAG